MRGSNHRCARYDESFRNATAQRQLVIFFSFLSFSSSPIPPVLLSLLLLPAVSSSSPRPYVTSSTRFPPPGRVDNSTCQLAHLSAPRSGVIERIRSALPSIPRSSPRICGFLPDTCLLFVFLSPPLLSAGVKGILYTRGSFRLDTS